MQKRQNFLQQLIKKKKQAQRPTYISKMNLSLQHLITRPQVTFVTQNIHDIDKPH